MREIVSVLATGLLLLSLDILAQTSEPACGPAAETEVLETQARRFRAMIGVDLEALESILSDDLTYTHTSGRMETKEEFVSSLVSQSIIYQSIMPTDIRIRVYNDTAVVTAISAISPLSRSQSLLSS